VRAAREKALSQDGVLEEKEEIGGIAPCLRAVGALQPALQIGPRRTAILATRIGVARGQAAVDRAAYSFVDEQAFAPELDERQRAEALHRVPRRNFRQEGMKQRLPADVIRGRRPSVSSAHATPRAWCHSRQSGNSVEAILRDELSRHKRFRALLDSQRVLEIARPFDRT
jgi:hypothetical protein